MSDKHVIFVRNLVLQGLGFHTHFVKLSLYSTSKRLRMKKNLLRSLPILLLFTSALFAQERPLTIEEEKKSNRLFLSVVNENLEDYDVSITVEGTGFKQRKGLPRKVRVPATSKVNIISLIVERGKQAMYTYKLDVTDSLSRRSIRKPFTKIKIDPKKAITMYITEKCTTCDTIINPLKASPYKFRTIVLSENEEVKSQLEKAFVGASVPLSELTNPVVSLDGKMYIHIETFEDFMMRLEEEGEPKPIEEENENK